MVSTLYMCLLCATPCSRVMESCRHADALGVQLSVLAHVNEATNTTINPAYCCNCRFVSSVLR